MRYQGSVPVICLTMVFVTSSFVACTSPEHIAKPDPGPTYDLVVPDIDAVRLANDELDGEGYNSMPVLGVCLSAGEQDVACGERILALDTGFSSKPDIQISKARDILRGKAGGYELESGFVEVGLEALPEDSPRPEVLTIYTATDFWPPFTVTTSIRVQGHWYAICDITADTVLAGAVDDLFSTVRCVLPKMKSEPKGVAHVSPPPSLIALSRRQSLS